MAESVDGGLELVSSEYRTDPLLANDQDFICQNPDANNVIYVVYSNTQPVVGVAGFVAPERIAPSEFYGREGAADAPIKQGKPWFRADKPVKMPFRK